MTAFDRACGMVERLPDERLKASAWPLFRKTALLQFAPEIVRNCPINEEETLEHLLATFFVPVYPGVAVCSPEGDSCVCVWPEIGSSHLGLRNRTFFCAMHTAITDYELLFFLRLTFPDDPVGIDPKTLRPAVHMEDQVLTCFQRRGKNVTYCPAPFRDLQEDHELLGTSALAAISDIHMANSPSNFLYSVSPELARPIRKNALPRSHERERYIVVPSHAVARVFRQPNPQNVGGHKAPHRRRAHFATLRAERYRWKRGQVIFRKSCWIGPREAVIKGERYRVVLDPPKQVFEALNETPAWQGAAPEKGSNA